jgi:hypothetical protein
MQLGERVAHLVQRDAEVLAVLRHELDRGADRHRRGEVGVGAAGAGGQAQDAERVAEVTGAMPSVASPQISQRNPTGQCSVLKTSNVGGWLGSCMGRLLLRRGGWPSPRPPLRSAVRGRPAMGGLKYLVAEEVRGSSVVAMWSHDATNQRLFEHAGAALLAA